MIAYANHYAGVSARALRAAESQQNVLPRLEAAEGIAYRLEEVVEELTHGGTLDMRPVVISRRADGMTGKIRDICDLCVLHQLLGHLVKLGLDPLLHARILPCQCASVEGRGQTGLLKKAKRHIRSVKLGVMVCQKTDVEKAYPSLKYDVVIGLIEREIPSARWILTVLRAIAEYAPDGHLIIGGYLDAWLFNYAMSYALRYLQGVGKTRRGAFIPHVKRAEAYMDDFALLSSNPTAVRQATKRLGAWMREHLGLKVKCKESEIHLMTYEQERARKKCKNKGCPCLDMGGYKIHRGYVTIRPGIFLRIRRNLIRAWREIQRLGTVLLRRARKLMAYKGYLKWTNSQGVIEKYHVREILKVARSVISYHARRRKMIGGKCYGC